MSQGLISVAIVDDDVEIRSLYQEAVNESDGFSCQHCYPNCKQALKDFDQAVPDVVLMDIDMPEMTGIECVKRLRATRPELPIVMLTVHEDNDAVFDSLCAGASGYLVKGLPPERLLSAIREAHEGGAPMSMEIARKVVHSFRSSQKSPLSPREMDVLKLLCDGENYKGVASKLFISAHTVKRHIRSIYDKLHVSTRAEMVTKAYSERLLR